MESYNWFRHSVQLKDGRVLPKGGWKIKKKLGTGSYGTTYLASRTNGDEEEEICLKVFEIVTPVQKKETEQEILALQSLRGHENVVHFYRFVDDVVEGIPCRFVEMQYCQLGNLKKYIAEEEYTVIEALQLILGIARGLEFTHHRRPPRIHGDLKLDNIAITKMKEAVIIDWGSSCQSERPLKSSDLNELSHVNGTQWYFSPERFFWSEFHTQDDVFAWGLIALQVLLKRTEVEIYQGICVANDLPRIAPFIKLAAEIEPEVGQLIAQCLSVDRMERPNASDIVARLETLIAAAATSEGTAASDDVDDMRSAKDRPRIAVPSFDCFSEDGRIDVMTVNTIEGASSFVEEEDGDLTDIMNEKTIAVPSALRKPFAVEPLRRSHSFASPVLRTPTPCVKEECTISTNVLEQIIETEIRVGQGRSIELCRSIVPLLCDSSPRIRTHVMDFILGAFRQLTPDQRSSFFANEIPMRTIDEMDLLIRWNGIRFDLCALFQVVSIHTEELRAVCSVVAA